MTPWFKEKPNDAALAAKLVETRRNELRLARALKGVGKWHTSVKELYGGKK